MMRWSWVVFLGFVLGCSDDPQCDLALELEAHAGGKATDCGFAERGEDPSSVDDCVVTSFENRTPFFARYFQQGIDSKVVFGIAGDRNGSVIFLLWDSDPSGGSEVGDVISGHTCLGPSVDSSPDRNPTLTPPLSCSGTHSLGQVCG